MFLSSRSWAAGVYHAAALPMLSSSGLFRLLRWLQRRSALILMYHGVMDTAGRGQPLPNVNQVDVAALRWQLEFIRKHYTVVPLIEIVRRIKRSEPIDGLAAITFDDGYLTVYENAAPILRVLNLPSTVFLIAGCVEQGHMPWYDRVEAHVLHTALFEIVLAGVTYQLERDRPG